ncbi:MAG TPA: hypothetical protein PKH98_05195, partial [Candidatus Omnitrophota bacterium]|nr:hypothetical protein [Candidatus Omnitrophota bacterium]
DDAFALPDTSHIETNNLFNNLPRISNSSVVNDTIFAIQDNVGMAAKIAHVNEIRNIFPANRTATLSTDRQEIAPVVVAPVVQNNPQANAALQQWLDFEQYQNNPRAWMARTVNNSEASGKIAFPVLGAVESPTARAYAIYREDGVLKAITESGNEMTIPAQVSSKANAIFAQRALENRGDIKEGVVFAFNGQILSGNESSLRDAMANLSIQLFEKANIDGSKGTLLVFGNAPIDFYKKANGQGYDMKKIFNDVVYGTSDFGSMNYQPVYNTDKTFVVEAMANTSDGRVAMTLKDVNSDERVQYVVSATPFKIGDTIVSGKMIGVGSSTAASLNAQAQPVDLTGLGDSVANAARANVSQPQTIENRQANHIAALNDPFKAHLTRKIEDYILNPREGFDSQTEIRAGNETQRNNTTRDYENNAFGSVYSRGKNHEIYAYADENREQISVSANITGEHSNMNINGQTNEDFTTVNVSNLFRYTLSERIKMSFRNNSSLYVSHVDENL